MARTTPARIRAELDADVSDLSDDDLAPFVSRAHHRIRRTVERDEMIDPDDEADADLLAELETLVGAAYAYKKVTGTDSGAEVRSVTQESASIEYSPTMNSSSDAAFGNNPHWSTALDLDPTGRLQYDVRNGFVEARR